MSDADWIEEALAEYKYEVPGDLRRDIVIDLRQAYAAHIATLDTDKLAERIAEICYPEIPGITDSDGVMFARESVRQNVEGILAPILARNAAMESVLRECRPVINNLYSVGLEMHFTHSSFDANDEKRRTDLQAMCDLLSRIDQLTAKGAWQ